MSANLILHVDSDRTDRETLRKVATPEATKTWCPIPHHQVLESVCGTLERTGLRIVNEALGLSSNGNRFFGLLEIENGHPQNGSALVVGIRNSHDRVFPVGLVCGSTVLVCDNLSFSGEIAIARRHTRYVQRDLPQLIETAVGRLGDLRTIQEDRIEHYKNYGLSDQQAHDLLINALDSRIVGPTRIPTVLHQWRSPDHPEFHDRNAWSLFNAFTQTLKGLNLHQISKRTQALHGLFDSYTDRVANTTARLSES